MENGYACETNFTSSGSSLDLASSLSMTKNMYKSESITSIYSSQSDLGSTLYIPQQTGAFRTPQYVPHTEQFNMEKFRSNSNSNKYYDYDDQKSESGGSSMAESFDTEKTEESNESNFCGTIDIKG
jgi:hypothetical protein